MPKRSNVYFDFEITRNGSHPNTEDDVWKGWPFGISAAAIRQNDSTAVYTYQQPVSSIYAVNETWDAALFSQRALSTHSANVILNALLSFQEDGNRVFAWNGVSFDWQLLAKLTGRWKEATLGAKKSYDPMFQGLCLAGFPVKQESVAMAFGYPGKVISGGNAPQLWEDGLEDVVVDYVQGDVIMLERIVRSVERYGGLKWTSKGGSTMFTPFFPRHLLTVEQALELPLPDTSWAKDDGGLTVTREQFTDWFVEA